MRSRAELRVFISSTFKDLHEEREHLVRTIFPEIRMRCRERGIIFTEVDLRWGLTDENYILGQIIRTCLEEIDRCRPYFIGITGDRYGFIPELTDIHKDPELLARYPWIEDAVMEEASIIDMEFRYGALDAPESVPAGRFFFRERDISEGETTEGARLENLKDRVRSGGHRVAEFDDPETLGRLIHGELLEIIRRDFSHTAFPTPLERERARHEAFALSRRVAYIPNATYLKRLNEHARGNSAPLVVCGGPGSGKSALIAFWAEQFRKRNPGAHIVEHYVGIGSGATDHHAVMEHLMMEIGERFSDAISSRKDPGTISHEFADIIDRIGNRQILLVVDGVDKLSGDGPDPEWIPDRLPSGVGLIVTTASGVAAARLRSRGWERLDLGPLSEEEREAIVVRFLSEYRKALRVDLVRRISADPRCGQPLFLRTMLEELRLFGRHEELDREVERFLAVTGPEDLFQKVLERFENDFSPETIRDTMSLIRMSDGGLSEIDLVEITGISRMRISALVTALDYHLLPNGDLLTFFHDFLRRAVEERYLADGESRRSIEMRLIEYFGERNEPIFVPSHPPFRELTASEADVEHLYISQGV